MTEGRGHKWPEALTWRILEAIPYNSWVSGREIAARVGARYRAVSMAIHHRLLHVYVERRPLNRKRRSPYRYRRLHRVGLEG